MSILNLSLSYKNSSNEQQKMLILRRVWDIEGGPGLLILSKLLGYSYGYLYIKSDIEVVRLRRNRIRRGRYNRKPIKKIKHEEIAIAEVALEAALGGINYYCGGKKTGHVCSNGSIKSASLAQSMLALRGQ